MRTGRFKKKFMNFALLLLAILCAVVAIEMFARIFIRSWAPTSTEQVEFWHYDSLLGWSHQPLQTGRFTNPYFSVSVSISAQGLRDKAYPFERVEGKRRLLVLGDSFGWGFGVEQSEIFSEVLERNHPEWEIINASVSGYGTDQEFLYLKERGFQFKPDVVLVLFFENDFYDNNEQVLYWYPKPIFQLGPNFSGLAPTRLSVPTNEQLILQNVPVPPATWYQYLSRYIAGKTYFIARLHWLRNWMYARGKSLLGGKSQNHAKLPCGSSDDEKRFRVTFRLFSSMNRFVNDRGARLVIVSVPMRTECTKLLGDYFQREAIPYLPLDSAFAGQQRTTTSDGFHWNAAGHTAAARAIESFLEERKFF